MLKNLVKYQYKNFLRNSRMLSSIKTNSINNLLDPHSRDTRNSLRQLFKKDIFIPKYNISLDEERQLADRLKTMMKNCFIQDFKKNPKIYLLLMNY